LVTHFSVAADGAGEITAAILAPGVNPACPAGRLFIVNDNGSPTSSFVWYWDLDALGDPPRQSTFDGLPGDCFIPGNDNDIVALGNGDVLFTIGMGFFQTPPPEVTAPVCRSPGPEPVPGSDVCRRLLQPGARRSEEGQESA
jgi:hypothetical protein